MRSVLAAVALLLVCAAPASAALTGTPETVAGNLLTPWEIVLLPDGRTWVTERDCEVLNVAADGSTSVIFGDPSVQCRKFLGLALHPQFATNKLLYLYETYGPDGGAKSRVLRLRETPTALVVEKVLLDGIGSDLNHDGGRMAFGPDGKLYVTTGDIHDKARPQDRQSLNGKILRLEAPGDDRDGTAPADNPFVGEGGNARLVWSYGHRHPQGLAWDASGRLWETEHGPSGEGPAGATCCNDEINLIEKGANYGWPLIAGTQTREGMRTPEVTSGNSATWAPAGAAVGPDGRLYVSNLRGQHVRSFAIEPAGLGAQATHFAGTTRYRAAVVGRGCFWFSTDAVRRSDGSFGGDSIRRVALTTGTEAPACPTAPATDGAGTATGGDTTGDGGATTGGGLLPQTPIAVMPRSAAATARDVLARTRAALARARLRGLLRRRGVLVGAGVLDAGTLRVRVTLRGKPFAVAAATRRGSTRAAARVRITATRRGRAALRRRSRARLQLRVTFTPAGGAPTSRSATFTVRR